MNWSEGSLGRVFVLRLDEGEVLNDRVEAFARDQGLSRGLVFVLGGADGGSRLVVGPAEHSVTSEGDTGFPATDRASSISAPILPVVHTLAAPHEILGVGTLFPRADGLAALHLHAATGREGAATVGCTRTGVKTWLVTEVVILEILGTAAARRVDPASGFELLQAG